MDILIKAFDEYFRIKKKAIPSKAVNVKNATIEITTGFCCDSFSMLMKDINLHI